MKDTDPVRDYLQSRSYADYIVEGGLEYLISAWEGVLETLRKGEVPSYEKYLGDVHRRRILQEALAYAPPDAQEDYRSRMISVDEQILPYLEPTEKCICGEEEAAQHGYTPELQWWYFHRPKAIDETWPDEF